MSNDYIIPDKEVALSDSTSIKSNVDSEIQENGGPIVSASKLYEILKTKGILNSIDLINDNSNSIKLLNDEIGELDSTSTGYKTIANRLTSLESNSGSGGNVLFNLPKLSDIPNYVIIPGSGTPDTLIENIGGGLILNANSNEGGFYIPIDNTKSKAEMTITNIMLVKTNTLNYNWDVGITNNNIYPTACLAINNNYDSIIVGGYTNISTFGTPKIDSSVIQFNGFLYTRVSIDLKNKTITFSKSYDNISFFDIYTYTGSDYTTAMGSKTSFIVRNRNQGNIISIPYLKIETT